MSKFRTGDRVCHKSNFSIKGEVAFVHSPHGGKQFYDVKRDDGGLETFFEEELMLVPISVDVWELLLNNAFSPYFDFNIGVSIYKLKNASTNTIANLKSSRTKFRPYQFKALLKFLASPSKRLLIADEVGLGKTIEAGNILLEMVGRGLLSNCLVICTNTLQLKWQTELREKFGVEFKTTDVPELINDITRDQNTGQKTVLSIINYEKCRSRSLYRFIEKSHYTFDLVICDEAHRLRNPSTQVHKAINNILSISDTVLFLTATPIMTSLDNLYSLVRLLEPGQYFDVNIFNDAINRNKPFVRAASRIARGVPLNEVAEELHSAVISLTLRFGESFVFSQDKLVSEEFQNDPLYNQARTAMLSGDDTLKTRAKVLADLSELNSLNQLYTRNRKREVLTSQDIIVRNAHTLLVTLTEEERNVYDGIVENYTQGPDSFELIQKKKHIASSIVAYLSTDQQLTEGHYVTTLPDSKYEVFRGLIEELVIKKKKIIVFSYYKRTLAYLKMRLLINGIECELIHGDIKDRMTPINRFRDDNKINILLSSEVGSEGVDLQFAQVIVNYDLPWNPMVVEQRIGRIDRVGQQSQMIHIYSFVIVDTIEKKIYERLLERLNIFKESLGDLEEILGEGESVAHRIEEMMNRLYKEKLSDEEQNMIIDASAQAIENQRELSKRIDAELTDSTVLEKYYLEEVNQIVRDNRYVTETALIAYVESLFRTHLTTCRFVRNDEHEFQIEFPNNRPHVVFDFLDQYRSHFLSNPVLLRRFDEFSKHVGKHEIIVTFNQEYAFQHPNIEYINSTHPLVQAATMLFVNNGYHHNRAHSLALTRTALGDIQVNEGHYFLCVYNVAIIKGIPANRQTYNYVHALLVDVNGNQPRILSQDVGDQIFGLTQHHASEPLELPSIDQSVVDILRPVISREIKMREVELYENERIRMTSNKERTLVQLKLFYENKITSKRRQVEEGRGIRDILLNEIAKLQREYEQRVEEIESAKIECRNDLISVNYLRIKCTCQDII